MKLEERERLFQEELKNIVIKYDINLRAANVTLENGEVIPMIKLVNTKKEDELIAKTGNENSREAKKDEDKTKK